MCVESLGEGGVKDLGLRNIGLVGGEHIFKDLVARMLDPSHFISSSITFWLWEISLINIEVL